MDGVQLLLVIIAAIAVTGLANRKGLQAPLVVVLVGLAASFIPGLPRLELPPEIILGIVLVTIGFFATHSVASALVGRLARDTKGHASSLYLLAYYLGSSIAGSLGGYFWLADGWSAVVGFILFLLAGCLVAALCVARLASR